jgi:hypothetical protein
MSPPFTQWVEEYIDTLRWFGQLLVMADDFQPLDAIVDYGFAVTEGRDEQLAYCRERLASLGLSPGPAPIRPYDDDKDFNPKKGKWE